MTAKKGFEKMMKAEDARGGRGGGGGRFVNEEFQWGVEGFSKDEKKTSVLDGMLRKHEGEGSFHRRLLFLMTLGGVCLVGFFSCALMTVSRVSSSWSIVTFAEASDSDATYHYPHLKELWEFHAQLVTTGATNAIMLLGVARSWCVGCPIDAILGFAAMVTSVVYHTLQTLEGNNPQVYGKAFFLAGDESDWHRADNIFAITCIITFFAMPLQLVCPMWNLLTRLVPLSVVVVAQCLRPWNFAFTLYPIVFFGVTYVVAYATAKEKPHLERRACMYSAVCFLFAVIFFFLGMDDENDYLRIYHGFWHVCVGLFVYFWTGACNPPHVVQARKRLLFATASDALLLSSQEKKFKQIAKFSSSSSPLELCACPTPCPPLAPSRSDSRLSRETSLAK